MINHPWYVPAGSAADGTASVAIDPGRPAGPTAASPCARCPRTASRSPPAGPSRPCCHCPDRSPSRSRASLRAGRPGLGVLRRHRLGLPPRRRRGSAVRSRGSEVALPRPWRPDASTRSYVAAIDVPIEIRGAGASTRQVTNFMAPEAFDGADKLMCVELLTPSGNWSSYPPHRHDDTDCPVNNEEIYYFRSGATARRRTNRTGSACTAPTPADGDVDVDLHVADGDVFLVPAATTARASPRPATRSTTSTSWPAPAASGRWRSATTRPTTGSARRGTACHRPAVPMTSAAAWP